MHVHLILVLLFLGFLAETHHTTYRNMFSFPFDNCSITLSHGEYEVLKSPTGSKTKRADLYLGKSKKGVYCALVRNCRSYRLRVWLLTELCGKMKWRVKIDISLLPVVAKFSWISHVENSGPWILHEGNCNRDGEEALVEDKFEWDFDKAIVLEAVDNAESEYMHGHIYFLGFHPYKEIAFLWVARRRVVAYHLCSSNVQDLGELLLQSVGDSFPYTPCWTGELFEKNCCVYPASRAMF